MALGRIRWFIRNGVINGKLNDTYIGQSFSAVEYCISKMSGSHSRGSILSLVVVKLLCTFSLVLGHFDGETVHFEGDAFSGVLSFQLK